MTDQQNWYRNAIIYRVYVPAFCDSNADGHGDIQGLISRLQHIQDLGADTIWLMPIFQFSIEGGKQGIVDFYKIQHEYGSLRDFEELINNIHSRRMHLILDLELNHTSDQHSWFISSRSDQQSQFRNYYVWSETGKEYHDNSHISANGETSNWHHDPAGGQFYWSRFSKTLPELNYDNPDIRTEIARVMHFWLAKGVDGFSLQGLPFLFEREGTNCENLPENHQYIKALRKFIDQNFQYRLLASAMNQAQQVVESYFGNGSELHLAVHPSLPALLFQAVIDQDGGPLRRILDQMISIPSGCQWIIQLTGPDGLLLGQVSAEEKESLQQVYAPDITSKHNHQIYRRLAPMLMNDQRIIRLLNALLFSLPGTPALFYGDEIGMGDGQGISGKVGLFFPMQWDETRGGGFSNAPLDKLYAPIIDKPPFDIKTINVVRQDADPESLLNYLKFVIGIRRAHPELVFGKLEWLDTDNPSVVAFTRRLDTKVIFAVFNISDRTCGARIPREIRQEPRLDLLGGYLRLQPDLTNLTLKPYQFGWFAI